MTRPKTFNPNHQTAALLPILAHIQSHLDEDLSLAQLAEKASLSPYHFHRLFHDTIGETLKQYTQRLRLERAAFDLKIRDATILEIALNWGFNAPETFTRAFKRWFGVTPRQYRVSYGRILDQQRQMNPTLLNELATETTCSRVTIQKLKPIPVAFVRNLGAYENVAFQQYDRLIGWADANGLYTGDNLLLGVGHDDPSITPTEKVRFDMCLSVPEPFQPDGNIGFQTISGGYFATMSYIGPLDATFNQVYHHFFSQLVQFKKIEIIGLPVIEIYRTTRINPAYALNETDIYIPVKKLDS
ncbi:AraC family transcriptional regulator [Candidatus Leptofilum sp.]|uniref:AraC family transcriptional regulator n=1 Tax=Candidatus Leptofilum sp. TaxID=3241576 RepID=UPI003B59F624